MTGFNSKREAAADKLQEPERKALKLALEALENVESAVYITSEQEAVALEKVNQAIPAIKEALAQPAQEPVAWVWKDMRGQNIVSLFEPRFNSVPLYTAPPQRPRVGLTDEEVLALWMTGEANISEKAHSVTAYEVEAKLKGRNHGT